MMRLINMFLLLAVLASALYLVAIQYESRRLFYQLDQAQVQWRELQLEHEQLRVEKRAQLASARIQQLAAQRLQMHAVSPAITTYVAYASSSAQSSAVKPVPLP